MNNNFLRNFIFAYLRSRTKIVVFFLIFAAIFGFVFFLYSLNADPLIFALIICIVISVIYVIYDFNKFYRHFSALKDAASNINMTPDSLPAPRNNTELAYETIIKELYNDRNRISTENAASKDRMSDYYAMWVHQIKVPISAMHMLLQEEPKSSPMNVELFKIEQYVEMALSYVRLESDYTDYVFKEHSLDSIVKQSVRKYAPLFISKKIALDIADTDIHVKTDEKWLGFVIEQILSNSLKYTKSGKISIGYQSPKTLVIKDTGIGISPEDLPRLGEKGFTGYNGRLYKKSTGLGLYLCKEILGRLSHTMEIRSEVNLGTEVFIHMETRDMIME